MKPDLSELKAAFATFDDNGDGTITSAEFQCALFRMNIYISSEVHWGLGAPTVGGVQQLKCFLRPKVPTSLRIRLFNCKKRKSFSPTGNRTLVVRVTGGNTHHYTIEELIFALFHVALLSSSKCCFTNYPLRQLSYEFVLC